MVAWAPACWFIIAREVFEKYSNSHNTDISGSKVVRSLVFVYNTTACSKKSFYVIKSTYPLYTKHHGNNQHNILVDNFETLLFLRPQMNSVEKVERENLRLILVLSLWGLLMIDLDITTMIYEDLLLSIVTSVNKYLSRSGAEQYKLFFPWFYIYLCWFTIW